MKFLAFYLFIFLIACSNDNSSEENKATNSSSETKSAPAEAGNDIVGEWEMAGFVGDTNDNLQIDEEERKNLKTPSFKDYMKLNSDGTGLFTVAKMEGRYEAKAKENGEKKYLTWYDSANGPHDMGTIILVTKDELHIKEPGGNGLFIWKRL
ncbi:MAG TPA: hypothetical protein VFH08_19620 [Chitinophagaceae bacterium]|nr:hypothetical protein [Chitinophagaceae bacterium]